MAPKAARPPEVVDPPVEQKQIEEKQAPPVVVEQVTPPPKAKNMEHPEVAHLTDIKPVYLVDRSGWTEFKRAINECGLIWNLPDWMTTIVHNGTEWKSFLQKGINLQEYFPVVEKKVAGDGQESRTSELGAKLVASLGFPKNMGEYITPGLRFCVLNAVEYEADRKLPARQKMWNWFVKCLRGPKPVPGPYHYLVDEVQPYDISFLFKRLCSVLEQITICSLDDELENVIKMDYKPQSQNIFSYLSELRKAVKRLHDLNERVPKEGQIWIPDTYVRSRLVRAARQVPVYKPVLDALLIKPLEEWSKITVDQLYHQLESVCANDISVQRVPFRQSVSASEDGVTANVVTVAKNTNNKNAKQKTCHEFTRSGSCSRENCKYAHVTSAPSAKKNDNKAITQPQTPRPPPRPPKVCNKCGVTEHLTKECKFSGNCNWCGRVGHKDVVCHDKRSGKPKALVAVAAQGEGVQVRANLTIVDEGTSQGVAMAIKAPDGSVCEKFYADTGANRSMHRNMRAAANFYRIGLNIGTAAGGKVMRSEGVGKMMLYTPSGKPMPGFTNVVFSKQVAEKLASVGELADSDLVCVFDKLRFRTYLADEVKIEGKIFTEDPRDPKTRLYPLTLFRRVGEKCPIDMANMLTVLNAITPQLANETKANDPKIGCAWVEMPEEILPDKDKLPTTLLARTYIKEGLSDLERYHAKFGDIGIKYIKRAMPSLKIPKQYRCEYCIEGKIHKFGHGPCPVGSRTEYLPGVCIHTDHSGPYAQSIGGARYSQLYLDRGSGYLWAARMAKKTGHYTETPKILLDSAALSGRRVQIFHSDGDGVFASGETNDLLTAEKIRHEYSAPYDSNTNPFVERARRTIFEGVCTALLRAGAPASFWGEAENHKIYSMNVLPTVPDPNNQGSFISRRNLLEGNRRPYNLNHLMAFGTAVTCYVPKERRRGGKEPAQRRSLRGVLVGYVENMPAYRIWDIDAKCVKQISFNFTVCHEGYYPFRDKINWPLEMHDDPQTFSPVIDGVLSMTEWKKFKFDEEDAGEVLGLAPALVVDRPEPDFAPLLAPHGGKDSSPPAVALLPPPRSIVEVKTPEQFSVTPHRTHDFWKGVLASVEPTPPATPAPPAVSPIAPGLRRSERLSLPKGNFTNVEHQEPLDLKNPIDKPVGIGPPISFKEAQISPWWPQYKDAAQVEFDGHIKSGTWVLVPKSAVPFGKNILRGKWVFDDKRGEDGKIVKFKARFVAMGFTQKYGVDFKETFAGVVVGKSFRIMLAILNEDPTYEMDHWDVRMAFTQAEVEEELFMYQPEGFEIEPDSKVCRLLRSLYGLRQSARNWQVLLGDIFREEKFFPLHADPCVFFLRMGEAWCMVSTHVDDIFVLYNMLGKLLRDKLFQKILSYVECEDLGPVSWALKTLILRDRQAGILKISQEQYTQEYLLKQNMSGVHKAKPTISDKNHVLKKYSVPFVGNASNTVDPDLDRVDETLKRGFQSDIGAMWWLAQISRPDIFYAVHRCSKLQNTPNKRLGEKIEQLKQYLAQTTSVGIVFQRRSNPLLLSGFVDAAFATEDEATSRIGYFFLFRGNLVSWCSENPSRIMTSSTEVECRGLTQIAKENAWHRQFHQELNLYLIDGPTTIFEDNTAAITLSKDPGTPHKRSKHFGIEWAFFKEAVELAEVEPVHVTTEEQPADMLTKGLPPKKFTYFRDMIMGGEKLQRHFEQQNLITHSIVLDAATQYKA